MYFSMFFLFLILIVGPGVAGPKIQGTLYTTLGGSKALYLMQPFGLDKNDTNGKLTGTAINKGAAATSGGSGGSSSSNAALGSSFANHATATKRAAFVYDMYNLPS